ncbi:AraC family transcriptional regulator [Chitinophaga sancti]|uniref:Helix-turn-helix domain-containing protein n=1 Tax=Chitinophaga sancti TaxID=1004 RepID=A0A1K1SUL6_9BACT|nr:DUF6597 domain-containing transcriptional factor [Chitinophaga sancti]WQD60548.1 helix-turn-helix domain-containing protein [Chitinophaga sancti]WQG87324.1 helix-turn-helix domain-containing protein [Chitinophaga sancti]SFW87932.1 Helix-turn-helix domain-containing protein [Chitinophaga sancti]
MYAAYTPPALLAPYIDAYWIVTTSGPATSRILPDLCADFIFNLDDYSVKAVGTMTTYHDTHTSTASRLLGIRFKPAGMAAFASMPMQLLTDQHIQGDALSLPLVRQLQEAIAQNTNPFQAISHCLLKALPDQPVRMQAAIHAIQSRRGNISPLTLAAQVNMSPRNFERTFLQQIGTSAKTFSRIVRCLSAKEALQKQPASSLLALAIDYGYHDHAHLTREFRQITGDAPSEYLSFLYK